ncbi:hypothetical protein J3B02_000578 [Coemansia erecta]|uniref:2-dehydropantoate 2-reductase n=1 Tax=Coemansia asiatica TaxID=1052880 RepID=A0A9W7XMZ5_9FUNG|nr:hypothetical protein LPJ64_000484 [Coemansia asiatica]KAJ2858046.1 hypothetical protein J3B02_000578 [Coemansia erecta]KAJ2865296.1 hypothetical protein FB639_005121 [Coemansia asiatica]
MKLKSRVLVVGGGAIGGLFAWRLSLSPAVTVSLVCRSNYQKVKTSGYLINSAQFGKAVYRPSAVFRTVEEAAAADGPFDYVIVALKALPNIYDSSESIQQAVGPNTMIVLFQNGIGIEEPFVKRFPFNSLVSSVSFVSVKQEEDGVLKHGGFSMIAAGIHNFKRSLGEDTEKLEHLFRAFESQGVSCTIESDIQPYRWQKHILNGSTNPVSVICGGSSCQEMVKNDYCRRLLEETMEEIFVLGKRVTGKAFPGVDGIVDPQSATEYISSIPVPVYTSMLVDSQCKRPMERDVILKNPIDLAEKLGVSVPHMKALYALVTMVEESYSK